MKDLLIVLGAFGLVALMGHVFGPNLLTLAFGLIWAVQDALSSQRPTRSDDLKVVLPSKTAEPPRDRLHEAKLGFAGAAWVGIPGIITSANYGELPPVTIVAINSGVGFLFGLVGGGPGMKSRFRWGIASGCLIVALTGLLMGWIDLWRS